jgi:hypothetical protein
MYRAPEIRDMEQLYRSVAAGDPREVVLQMIYDMFGKTYELRPPMSEMRLADRCQPTEADARG